MKENNIEYYHWAYQHSFGVRANHWLLRFLGVGSRVPYCTCCDHGHSPLGTAVTAYVFAVQMPTSLQRK